MNQTPNSAFMAEKDLLHTILCDLKRTVREYVTGVTEAACPTVRSMFTDLTNSTMKAQGELFTLMEKHNMYAVSSPVLRQEITKQLQQQQQTEAKAHQFVQQKLQQQPPQSHQM